MDNQEMENEKKQSSEAILLFVDDEANILASLKRIFRPLGYQILTAQSGSEGLELLKNHNVDLIVSDMHMPNMDGVEFLGKAAEKWPDTVRVLLTGYADMESTIAAINNGKIYMYISKPWDDNDVRVNIQRAVEKKHLKLENRRLGILAQKQNEELIELNANLERKVNERTAELKKAHEDLKKSFAASVKIFSSMISYRVGESPVKTREIAEVARRLAKKMGLSEAESQDVVFAGLLRDLGKIAMPDRLLHKPYKMLDPNEKNELIEHFVIGETYLMSLNPLKRAARLIRSCGEYVDGKGFPDGIKGDQIPLGARILAVVTDFYAYQFGKIESSKLSEEEAKACLEQECGSHYDADVVAEFFSMLEENASEQEQLLELDPSILRPGMVLSSDLYSNTGIMLLATGSVLDENLVYKIKALKKARGMKLLTKTKPIQMDN